MPVDIQQLDPGDYFVHAEETFHQKDSPQVCMVVRSQDIPDAKSYQRFYVVLGTGLLTWTWFNTRVVRVTL